MRHAKCRLCGAEHPLGGPHVWDKESTAARKDVRSHGALEAASPRPRQDPDQEQRGAGGDTPAGLVTGNQQAGTQAPSVDNKSKRGRPSTGFDKKAYQRELMRKRRAKNA